MNTFTDFDEKITCPYDKSHFIRKSRMSTHLVKCAKNFPNVEYQTCDFNSTHRVPKPELRYHHENCEDRRVIESKILQIENQPESTELYPIANTACEEDERWDDEEHPTYNPTEYCEQNNVLRHIDVQSASTRRNFRLNERLRLGRFNADNESRENNIRGSIWDGSNTSRMQENIGERPSSETVSIAAPREEAFDLSLNDRIRKGNNRTYQPRMN